MVKQMVKKTTRLTVPSIVAIALSHKGLCGSKYSEARKQLNSEYRSVGAKYFAELDVCTLSNMYLMVNSLYNADDFNFEGDRYSINVVGNRYVKQMCMDIASVELDLDRTMDTKYESMLKNIIDSSFKFDYVTQNLYSPE